MWNALLHVSSLTHLCKMYFPFLINWMSPFPILGLMSGIFPHFYSNFKRHVCKQTVDNLIRRRVLRRLIWFCTVCQCPTKRTLGLNKLVTGLVFLSFPTLRRAKFKALTTDCTDAPSMTGWMISTNTHYSY